MDDILVDGAGPRQTVGRDGRMKEEVNRHQSPVFLVGLEQGNPSCIPLMLPDPAKMLIVISVPACENLLSRRFCFQLDATCWKMSLMILDTTSQRRRRLPMTVVNDLTTFNLPYLNICNNDRHGRYRA